jgi:hypothetical protein
MTEQPEITVSKMVGYVQASKQLMDDCAFDLNAVFNPTRRQRVRRRWSAFRGRTGERAYRLIAGRDLPEPEPPDDWDD